MHTRARALSPRPRHDESKIRSDHDVDRSAGCYSSRIIVVSIKLDLSGKNSDIGIANPSIDVEASDSPSLLTGI